MKKIIGTLIIAVASSIAFSQQEYSYTFFNDNRSFTNPAAVGTEGFGSVTGAFRTQWAGMDGAPTSGGVTFQMPLKNMGVGAMVYQDHIGVTNQTNIAGMYSYHLKISREHKVAFGVSAGMDLVNTKYDRLLYWDAGDQVFSNDYVNVIVPHIGIGAQYFFEDFYAGISVPRLVSVNSDQFNSINFADAPSMVTHAYLSSGYTFRLKNDVSLIPSILAKYTKNTPPRVDVSFTTMYKDMLGFGLAYKSLGFLSVYMKYQLKDFFVIGYGFDFSMNALQSYSKGSHEVMLQYRFGTTRSMGAARMN
ncbi:MAG: type IX secretion system membrane protein PorP/SprF [Crocinitomicaceae bacterium]|nr:type IX secretion system membrane protein PorP/SprF [Crocinitomicaceae bacterium]